MNYAAPALYLCDTLRQFAPKSAPKVRQKVFLYLHGLALVYPDLIGVLAQL